MYGTVRLRSCRGHITLHFSGQTPQQETVKREIQFLKLKKKLS